ncbi:hypothetical protein N9W17_05280 [Jannaschia sp.]|nr:hypothetical protein [Jannaschia sp.]
MLRKLKSRTAAERAASIPAARPRLRWDRTIYLILLFIFAAALLDYVAGDRVFLKADGLVLRDRTITAATTLVRVSDVAVRPGQTVAQGDVLVRAQSIEVLGRLADLSVQDADLAQREAALSSQLNLAAALLPTVLSRRDTIQREAARLSALATSGGLTADRREAIEDRLFAAEREATTVQAQVEGLAAELAAVTTARRRAGDAGRDLSDHYARGLHLAGAAGVVGDRIPSRGEVFRPGEPIVTVHTGAPYVLLYLPERYLFGVTVGDRVVLRHGRLRHGGVVERILPISQSVPDEFRTAFRLGESRQMARVRLDSESRFAAGAPVEISRPIDPERVLRWATTQYRAGVLALAPFRADK